MATVTINVNNGSSGITIPWSEGNVQDAMQIAYDQTYGTSDEFDFAVQFYGSKLGYFVIMIDGQYDDPNNPNDYWLYYVNGIMPSVGIDSYILKDGDVVDFEYISYNEIAHKGSSVEAKREHFLKRKK